MTIEEILLMPAGAAMDRLIAEKVMGWYWDKHKRVYRIDPKDNSLFGVGWGDDDAPNGYFEPSSDISAAWEAVEKLREKKIKLVLFENQSGDEYQNYYAYFGGHHRLGNEPWDVGGETACLAICRAALLTVKEIADE